MGTDSRICAGSDVESSGLAVRFQVQDRHRRIRGAFVVRFQNKVYAYLNECAHRAMELDWNPGDVFDAEGENLICATHGAIYNPVTGVCVGGPCNGGGLISLTVVERDGQIYLQDSNYHLET